MLPIRIPLRHHSRPVPPRRRSIIQRLDIRAPLVNIRPQHAAIVRDQAVDLALYVGGLRPDAAGAGVALCLVGELGEKQVRAVVVGFVGLIDFVGLVDGVDGLLDVPEAGRGGLVGWEVGVG